MANSSHDFAPSVCVRLNPRCDKILSDLRCVAWNLPPDPAIVFNHQKETIITIKLVLFMATR